METTTTTDGAVDWKALAPSFGELQDLKRQRPAHLEHSIATELFRLAWRGLLGGSPPDILAYRITVIALTNVLFPGCDEHFFPFSGLEQDEARAVLEKALAKTAPDLPEVFAEQLPRIVAGYFATNRPDPKPLPEAVELLCRQPRAGATRPGVPRLLLTPPEMHSDHCLMTAVYGVLVAAQNGADVGKVFACAIAHHLHNAYLPDCGFAGEMCLGEHLETVITSCRERALEAFPNDLQTTLRDALVYHDTIDTPEGRAESAGDVLDRVLDVKWRTRAAGVTDADVLDDLDLVHAGPLRDFQADILGATGLYELK